MNCSKCETPATNRCSRCYRVCYCSIDCQHQHWAAHKTACNELRRELRRVADILYTASLTFRENTWAGLWTGVDIQSDSMVAHFDPNTVSIQWFTEFPHRFVAGDDQARRALLTLNGCDHAYACLYILVKKLLEGSVQLGW